MNFAPVAARRSAAGPNAGRELKLTPIVRRQENAQASAPALGRLQGSSRISVVVHPCAFVRVGSVNKKGQLGWVASIGEASCQLLPLFAVRPCRSNETRRPCSDVSKPTHGTHSLEPHCHAAPCLAITKHLYRPDPTPRPIPTRCGSAPAPRHGLRQGLRCRRMASLACWIAASVDGTCRKAFSNTKS